MKPSKHKMTVLSQIFKLIPRNLIPKLANEFGIDRQSRVFSPTSHMLKEKNEIFRGDSLEIFISTYPNPLYREIIVNPRGDQFDAWHVTNPFGGFVTPKRRYEAPEIITIVRRQSDWKLPPRTYAKQTKRFRPLRQPTDSVTATIFHFVFSKVSDLHPANTGRNIGSQVKNFKKVDAQASSRGEA